MRIWLTRTPLLRCALLGVLAVLTVAGCDSAGGLHDAGQTRAITSHPSPLPLWPAAETSAPPSPQPVADQSAPEPLPGLAVGGLQEVDARTVLGKDPELTPAERTALDGGCPGCLVQPAQYRDLSGDGRPELLTAVVTGAGTGGGRAVLHVYTQRDRQVLPVLALTALPGFTADTAGQDLVVHEPTGPLAETSSTYRWNSVRMAFADRRTEATGPAADLPGCPPDEPTATPVPSVAASAAPAVAPTARPTTRGPVPPAVPQPSPARTR
ncbi:hypothetical protein OG871_03950 [Kitasatospora sp. NBC_00374]|uniref:hypothetical protein n=1 Tax=Kitasatospora sp. NBC_00374 TaxID=2975964 RepID=UPI0030E3730D